MAERCCDIAAATDLEAFLAALGRSKVRKETIAASCDWLIAYLEKLAAARGLSEAVMQGVLCSLFGMLVRDFQDFISVSPVVTGGATEGLGLRISFDLTAYRRFAEAAQDLVNADV